MKRDPKINVFVIVLCLTIAPLLFLLVFWLSWHGIRSTFNMPQTVKMRDVIPWIGLAAVGIDSILIWIFLNSQSNQLLKADGTNNSSLSGDKYQLLLENMPDVVWTASPEGRITYINDACRKILGYTSDEVIGKEFYRLMCPLHDYDGSSCYRVIMEMKTNDYESEQLWMIHSDANTRKVLEVKTRRVEIDGELIEIQGVGRDVTQRILNEKKAK